MKFRTLTLAVLATLAAPSFALDIATSNAASTVKVYASGATATRAIIGGMFTQNCAPGTLDVYYSDKTAFGGSDGDAHRVYTCTLQNEGALDPEFQGKDLGGKNLAFFKSDEVGSAFGVYPIATDSAIKMLQLEAANCSARVATVPNYKCKTTINQVPMVGTSDLEPKMFVGLNRPADYLDDLSDDQLGSLSKQLMFQTVFAVAVNKRLYQALQGAQGLSVGAADEANRPSVSRLIAGSLFRGELQDPASGAGWQSLVPGNTSQVNICRRVAGSGTQAAANLMFGGMGCALAAQTPANNESSGLPNDLANVSATGNFFVYEGSGTGNVVNCLNAAETASGAFAIGHVSKENAESATWKHVKLDGVSPHRDNLKAGKYDYAVESTIQFSTARHDAALADSGNPENAAYKFVDGFVVAIGLPRNMAQLSANVQAGVAAMPESYAGAYGTGTAAEITFGSRVSRGGDSCLGYYVAK